MHSARVLVLGGPSVGKTHFAGQLLGRLKNGKETRLRLCRRGTDDLTHLEEVLRCLEEGRSAGHTPSETWTGITCRLRDISGREVDLTWPEYAGEKILQVADNRSVSATWRDSAANADVWVLMLRLSSLRTYEDGISRPTVKQIDGKPGNCNPGWDDQARYIELLQMLLFTTGNPVATKISKPKLLILLSCWDELKDAGPPLGALRSRLPLLSGYLDANWGADALAVWGLSSLGCALDPIEVDNNFREKGPENAGYVVPSNSLEKQSDLTLPLSWALEFTD